MDKNKTCMSMGKTLIEKEKLYKLWSNTHEQEKKLEVDLESRSFGFSKLETSIFNVSYMFVELLWPFSELTSSSKLCMGYRATTILDLIGLYYLWLLCSCNHFLSTLLLLGLDIMKQNDFSSSCIQTEAVISFILNVLWFPPGEKMRPTNTDTIMFVGRHCNGDWDAFWITYRTVGIYQGKQKSPHLNPIRAHKGFSEVRQFLTDGTL